MSPRLLALKTLGAFDATKLYELEPEYRALAGTRHRKIDRHGLSGLTNVHEAKSSLSSLLAEIEKSGKRIAICRNGEPIADLVPHRREMSMAADKRLGAIKIKYDPTEEASEADWPRDDR